MWYSSKMMKKSYKKYPKGTEQRSLSEELSLTGMPPDMIDKLGLRTKKDAPVYRLPKEKFLEIMRPLSISSEPLGTTIFNKPLQNNLFDIGEDKIEKPAVLLRKNNPIILTHEATHWNDLQGERPDIAKFSTSILEYNLNDLELSAIFNEIIYFLYSKNNATFPMYQMYRTKEIKNLGESKEVGFLPDLFLWGLIKDSFKKNGLQKTIDIKKEIIEKSKDQVLDSIIPHILDIYLKTSKASEENIYNLGDLLIGILEQSKNLTYETIEKIKEKFYYYATLPSRDWIPQPTKDEIYNFYGERHLRDQEEK